MIIGAPPSKLRLTPAHSRPTDDHEPAIVATLSPGNYTAIARGAGDTTGIALVEMYDLDQPPQADGSTLYVTSLRSQGAANSPGSGTASLRLSGDETSAIFSFEFSNLTGPVTGMHIHASDGTILFDVGSAIPQLDGSYLWVFTPVGSFTVADIIAALRAGQLYFSIHTAAYPFGEISGFLNLSDGGASPTGADASSAAPVGHADGCGCRSISFASNFWRDRCVDCNSPKPGI